MFWDTEAKVSHGEGRQIMNSYCVSFPRSLSLCLPLLPSLPLCLLIVHVTMSITQLLISFGLRNSSADLSEAAGWNLPSMTGALCVCVRVCVCVCMWVCVYPQYRKTPTHWERAPLDSKAESPVRAMRRSAAERWQSGMSPSLFAHSGVDFLAGNCSQRYGIFQGALFLIGSPNIELGMSLMSCFCHQYTAASI